jgi:sarcosine/dimethylglycine N-methyltransferase
VRQDERTPFERALGRARATADAHGEGFMTRAEILGLAARAGIGPGVEVLDVGCGVGGPGRLITRELGCDYLGVDFSETAVALARERAPELEFVVAEVPPLPPGRYDVVLLLEAMLAVPDKDALLEAVAGALRPGGRFAFTVEEGAPLSAAERAAMPDPDTVWLTPLAELNSSLKRAGLAVTWQVDHSRAHRATARALAAAYAADGEQIAARLGRRALDDLLAAHRLWIDWLETGRVRKLACVAELTPARAARAAAPAPCPIAIAPAP